jgi:hypothetical protein
MNFGFKQLHHEADSIVEIMKKPALNEILLNYNRRSSFKSNGVILRVLYTRLIF